jgi:hypothetical protein
MCVGDLNNDNIDDLVVTAEFYYAQIGQNHQGKVYIYFGRSSLNSIPDLTITGSYPGARLGANCAIGDFNDDGFNDLAIRGYDVTMQQSFFGYLNIHFGSAQLDTVADLTSNRTGQGAATSGGLAAFDANGDQKIDLLWTFVDASSYERSVFIHYGGADFQYRFPAGPDFIIHGPIGSGEFGNEICNAGDMNGDGADDIVIAAYATGQENGIIFVYTGGKAIDDQFDAARGQALDGNFGRSISSVGDINHDGYSDIIIGAPSQPWGWREGYFGIFLGDPRIPTNIAIKNIDSIPSNFVLYPAYPNPFNVETIFKFSLSHQALIEIAIYNILGKEVKSLLKTEYNSGKYKVPWDGKKQTGETVPNGIYFCRMRAIVLDNRQTIFEQTQKFTVIK